MTGGTKAVQNEAPDCRCRDSLSEMPRVLDVAVCEDLKQRWRDQGAPLVNHLRPGLSDDEMDALTAEVGIRLPAEARVWWAWHDGGENRGQPGDRALEMGPGHSFLSLAEAIHGCRMWRRVYEDFDPPIWQPGWLPITSSEREVVIDCGVGSDDPIPVYSVFSQAFTEDDPPAAGSMGELVEIWIDAIDSGAWSYDQSAQRWNGDDTQLHNLNELTWL